MNAPHGAAAAPNGTVPITPPAVTVDRDARILREALSRCRRDVTSPWQNAHAQNLAKRVSIGRVQLAEHLVILLRDAMERGAPQADVEGFARTLLAIVRAWYHDAADRDQLTLVELVRAETAVQAAADLAEVDLLVASTPKAIADATDRVDQHLLILEQLSGALHRARAAA